MSGSINFSDISGKMDINNFLAPKLENTPPSSPEKSTKRKATDIFNQVVKQPKTESNEGNESSSFSLSRMPRGGMRQLMRSRAQNYAYSGAANSFPIPSDELSTEIVLKTLCKNVVVENHKSVEKQFEAMLQACWDSISLNLDYSNTNPLFFQNPSADYCVDVLIPRKNVFYFIGNTLGMGIQSVARAGICIRYCEKKGFYLDPENPNVVIAHASTNRLGHISKQAVKKRYSDQVMPLLEQLGKHKNVVPKPLYVLTNPAKVVGESSKDLTLGQISVEPIMFDNASNKHTFQSLAEIKNRALQVASGLKHIHQNGMLHRDLKGDNVFIKGDDTRIGDLELLCKADDPKASRRSGAKIGHIMEIKNYAHERMAFGYLIKHWLSSYLKKDTDSKSEACFSLLASAGMISRNACNEHNLDANTKAEWLKLFDFADNLTHFESQERGIRKHDLQPPMELDAIIAGLSALDLNL